MQGAYSIQDLLGELDLEDGLSEGEFHDAKDSVEDVSQGAETTVLRTEKHNSVTNGVKSDSETATESSPSPGFESVNLVSSDIIIANGQTENETTANAGIRSDAELALKDSQPAESSTPDSPTERITHDTDGKQLYSTVVKPDQKSDKSLSEAPVDSKDPAVEIPIEGPYTGGQGDIDPSSPTEDAVASHLVNGDDDVFDEGYSPDHIYDDIPSTETTPEREQSSVSLDYYQNVCKSELLYIN